nr:hypothetical protein [Tanacetum cinerariifolium]
MTLDELSRGKQESIPWGLIFTDDIVLVLDTPEGLNKRLEEWKETLKDKGLRKSSSCDYRQQDERRKIEMVWACQRRPQLALIRKVEYITVDDVRRRGRPKLRWEDKLKTDLKKMLLSEDMTSDRNSWRTRVRVDEEDA